MQLSSFVSRVSGSDIEVIAFLFDSFIIVLSLFQSILV
jgi:hypothetical protein